jgi:hypothetical protein
MSHKNTKNILTILIAVSAITLFSNTSYAAPSNEGTTHGTFVKPTQDMSEGDWKPHVGVILGMSNPEGNFNSAVNYGIDIGFQPYIPFGAGLEISSGETHRQANGRHENMRRTLALARGTYNFGGDLALIRHSYVGALLGPTIDDGSSYDGVHLGLGPIIGFDIPLYEETQQGLTLGANAKYLFVNDAAPDLFALNGVLKYWF